MSRLRTVSEPAVAKASDQGIWTPRRSNTEDLSPEDLSPTSVTSIPRFSSLWWHWKVALEFPKLEEGMTEKSLDGGIVESSPECKSTEKVEDAFMKHQESTKKVEDAFMKYQDLSCWQCAASVSGKMLICENYGLPVPEPHGRDGFTALCPEHHGQVGSSTKYMKVADVKSINKVQEDRCMKYQELVCFQCAASVPGQMMICHNYGLPVREPHGRDGFTALCPEHYDQVGYSTKHMQVADASMQVADVKSIKEGEDPPVNDVIRTGYFPGVLGKIKSSIFSYECDKEVEDPYMKYQNLWCWQCAACVPGQMLICDNYGLPVPEPHGLDGFTALCPEHHGMVGCSTKHMQVADAPMQIADSPECKAAGA